MLVVSVTTEVEDELYFFLGGGGDRGIYFGIGRLINVMKGKWENKGNGVGVGGK